MRVFMWHVHGSYQTNFVQGRHDVLVPVDAGRGPDGRGRAQTWEWPERVAEVTAAEAAAADVDVVVLQRPHELELAERWLGGRRPGRDVPAVYLEHNCPQGPVNGLRHPVADRGDLTVVHVTHFNDRFWDCGRAPRRVIAHGVIDPGHRYTGESPRAAVVVNEPVRRARVAGTDLLPAFGSAIPLDLFGMGTQDAADALVGKGLDVTAHDLPQHALHTEVGRRRAYVHPYRWTSLGLSLIEAMLIGLPVVALATTEVPEVVPEGCGVVSNDLSVLTAALRRYRADRDLAAEDGARARRAARRRFDLDRFLDEWDAVLKEVCT
jgi:hypothetical protein